MAQSMIPLILIILGLITPQTLVVSDAEIHTGNGQWPAASVSQYIPAQPDLFLVLNTSENVRAAWSEIWLRKMFAIQEINRAVLAALEKDNRKSREMKAVFDIGKQILKLKPKGIAAGLYINGKKKSIHIVAAADCDRMDTLGFFLETIAIMLQADRKLNVRNRGKWMSVTTVKPLENKIDIAAAVSEEAVLFELALNAPPEKISAVINGNSPTVHKAGTFARHCVTARGDSSDMLFFAVNTPQLVKKLKHIDEPSLRSFIRIFEPQELGHIVYSIRPEGIQFKEHFSVIASSEQGLLIQLINFSEKIDSNILKLVPENALYVQAGGYRFNEALDAFIRGLKNHEDTTRNAQRIEDFFTEMTENGIDIKTKVISRFKGTSMFCMTLPEPGIPIPGIALIFRTDTPGSVMEILELIQNDKFMLTRREIEGVSVYTARVPKMPAVLTFGPVECGGNKYFAAASTPEIFLKIIKASSAPAGTAFLQNIQPQITGDTLFIQYLNCGKLGEYTYQFLPMVAQRNPFLRNIDTGKIPQAGNLFGDMPVYTAVSARSTGTEISTPVPGMRLLSAAPALLPLIWHTAVRRINAPAIKARENEKKIEELKEKMKKEKVDIF